MVTVSIFVRKSAKITFFWDVSQHHVSEVTAFFPPFVPTCDFLYSDLFSFFLFSPVIIWSIKILTLLQFTACQYSCLSSLPVAEYLSNFPNTVQKKENKRVEYSRPFNYHKP